MSHLSADLLEQLLVRELGFALDSARGSNTSKALPRMPSAGRENAAASNRAYDMKTRMTVNERGHADREEVPSGQRAIVERR